MIRVFGSFALTSCALNSWELSGQTASAWRLSQLSSQMATVRVLACASCCQRRCKYRPHAKLGQSGHMILVELAVMELVASYSSASVVSFAGGGSSTTATNASSSSGNTKQPVLLLARAPLSRDSRR
jgi:hypothetical protein